MAKREELEADILFVCVKVLKAREEGVADDDGKGGRWYTGRPPSAGFDVVAPTVPLTAESRPVTFPPSCSYPWLTYVSTTHECVFV